MDEDLQHESDDSDEGFLEGDIVDNIFNVKGANAHLEMDFELATKYVRGLAASASQEDLLFFYGRYKQVTEGPCNVPKPSFYQLKEKSKWAAWQEVGERSRTDCQLEYIQRLTELAPGWKGEEVGEAGGLAALKTVWPSGQGGDWNSTGSGRAGARIPQPSLSSSLHSLCTPKSPSHMLVEGSNPSLPPGPVADRQRGGIEPLCITAPRELKSRPSTSLSHPGLHISVRNLINQKIFSGPCPPTSFPQAKLKQKRRPVYW